MSLDALMNNWEPDETEYRTLERFPYYRFGADGSCWSLLTRGRNTPNDYWRELKGKLVDGYTMVELLDVYNLGCRLMLHKLILEAFVGPAPSDKPFGLHRNDIRSDNRVDNLYWGTKQDNGLDKIRNGGSILGQNSVHSKLTDNDVITIRHRYHKEKATIKQLAIDYDVSRATISDIIRGKKWKHLL